jgi:Tol biopolymer transport system component
VQQLPTASSGTTPDPLETPSADGTLARRGILVSAAAPAVSSPNIIEGADHTSLSPDGRQIAFDLDRDGVRGVFVADRHGGNVSLASGDGRAAAPIWSPDADHLAFVRAEPDRPMVWNLWMRRLSTGALTRLTDHATGIVRGASWFPDARRICYAHQQTLVILDTQSGRTQTFRAPVASLVRAPSVSPDGRRVAFEIEGSGIWMMDVERQVMEQIIQDPAPSSLAWQPEADALTYFSLGAREWRAWRPGPRS